MKCRGTEWTKNVYAILCRQLIVYIHYSNGNNVLSTLWNQRPPPPPAHFMILWTGCCHTRCCTTSRSAQTCAGYCFMITVAVAFWENVKSRTHLRSGAESSESTSLFRRGVKMKRWMDSTFLLFLALSFGKKTHRFLYSWGFFFLVTFWKYALVSAPECWTARALLDRISFIHI